MLGLALIGIARFPFRIGGIPLAYAAPGMGLACLITAALGATGVNIWTGGPFDAHLDETAGPTPSESESARIRAAYMLLVPSALGLALIRLVRLTQPNKPAQTSL